MSDPTRPEPPPVNRDDEPDIADLVIADIEAKKAAGIEKYGVPLRARNGRRAIVDLYQELIDAAQYVRQLIREEETGRVEGESVFTVAVSGNPTNPRSCTLRGITKHALQVLLQLRDAGAIDMHVQDAAGNVRFRKR